jgi:bifunctional dethiobiotin synthetase / adenosylmethionine---8-amino-7-oxononanoate aminotransferase
MQDITTYTKPVQTGFPTDSDGRLVSNILGCRHHVAPHASFCETATPAGKRSASGKHALHALLHEPAHSAVTLHAWKTAVSPHLAVQLEGRPVSDSDLCDGLMSLVAAASARGAAGSHQQNFGIIETAGGVCSPTPAGSRQVRAHPRVPACLILHLRGFDFLFSRFSSS